VAGPELVRLFGLGAGYLHAHRVVVLFDVAVEPAEFGFSDPEDFSTVLAGANNAKLVRLLRANGVDHKTLAAV